MIEEGLYYLCSENKEADQLRSYCAADLHLCFAFANNWFSYYVAPLNHYTIYVVKTKKLISCAVTAQLICIFVFPFEKNWCSYYVAPLNHCRKNNDMNINVALYATQIC